MSSLSNASSSPIKLLLVEDDQIDRLAFTRKVKQAGLPYDYTLASSLSEAIHALDRQTFEIAVLDYNLGDGYASDLFPILKAQNCPFVISTGSGDEETAARLMSQGASDYLIKDPERNYLQVLPATVSKALTRYQADEQLRLLNHAMQSVKDGLYIVDAEGRLLFANDAIKKLCRLELSDVTGQSIEILGQPSLTERTVIQEPNAWTNAALDGEILLRQSDDADIPILLSECLIQDGSQRIRVGLMRDITPLKQVETALRHTQENLEQIVEERTAQLQQAIVALQQENQERLKAEQSLRASHDLIQQQQAFLRSVIDTNPNLIFVKDWDGRFLLANQAMAEFSGTTVEDLIGRQDQDINVPPEESGRYLQENRQVIASGEMTFLPEERVYREGLGEQWQQWHKRPIQLPDSNVTGVLGIGVNITARKRVEFALQESEQRFSSLAATAPVGIFRTDTLGNCLYVNDRWCRIAGLSPEQAMGQGWLQAIHPDDQHGIRTEWHQSVQEERPFQLEYRFQRSDGIVTWVFGESASEMNKDGQVVGYIGTITDISDRKRAEITLQKLLAGTAAVTGADFFPALVRHLAEALDVHYALVTEQRGDELHTLGFWAEGSLQPALSYSLTNTPCAYVLQEGEFYCESGVQNRFPQDLNLVEMQVDGCLGVSLKDDFGNPIGSLCILDPQPIREAKRSEAIPLLQVFAARAAAELQRKTASDALYRLNQDLEGRVEKRTNELQAHEAQLRDLFDNATDLIQSISLDGQLLFVNRAWKETLGYTDDDLQQLSIFQIIHPDELVHCQTAMQQLFEGIACIGLETRFLTKKGQEIIVEGNVNCRIQDGQPVATRGIFRDITQRKQAENALRESQQFLQTVLDAFPLFVFWKNRDSVYLGCNENFATVAGVASPTEIIGKTDYDLPWGESEGQLYRADDRKVMDSGITRLGIAETQHQADGQVMWVETNKVPLRDLRGDVIGVLGTYQDITDRKQAEVELYQTNQELIRATRLKDEFLANMSHELRTPLNAILGMTEGLQEEIFGTVNAQQIRALHTVENSAYHLLSLINDILDVAKIESGQIELEYTSVPLIPLCSSSLAFIKQQALKKGIQLETDFTLKLPNLWVDELRIRQVLINLLTNAVKFTSEGGKITFKASYSPATENRAQQNYLRIAVIDTGIGISPENIKKLFKPFVQIDSTLNRQYTGTGLGLALVKQIVELHGGQVELTSTLGVGSCFSIDLPFDTAPTPSLDLVNPTDTRQSIESNLSPNALSSPLILLAEDNEANINTVTSYLEMKGYRILLARNGRDAINFAQDCHPDLILMDIQMPEVDGLEAIKQIRRFPTLVNVPIIALTALAMETDKERCLQAGADIYMAKPFKLKQLVATIQQCLSIE